MSEVKEKIIALQKYLDSRIIGQKELVRKLVITLLADGHALLEGAPGLAKTKAIKTLSECIRATYNRIQFTPDLLPSDITGSDIYIAERCEFEFRKGPIFANLVLADEINRAPAKVQSALLEAMEERQVTVDGHSYQLENPFSVIATQNPVGASGTQLLPDSQTDRFTVRISMGYPNFEAECQMLINRSRQNPLDKVKQAVTVEELINMQNNVKEVFVSEDMAKYIVMLVTATRQNSLFERGASPRAALSLKDMAKAAAFADGRDYIVPRDIQNIFVATISHRVILSAEANAKKISVTKALNEILRTTRQPKI